jgi:uncharacterized protein (DUF302 family)
MRQAIKTIAEKLKKDGFQTILVVPPSGGQKYDTSIFHFL